VDLSCEDQVVAAVDDHPGMISAGGPSRAEGFF
jgi:hypothetical protein